MLIRIVFISTFLYTFLSACGGGFWPEDYEFNFLHKRDFFFSNIDSNLNYAETYNNILMDSSKETKKVNLEEWQKEFGKTYSKRQIEGFLYEKKNLAQLKNVEIRDYIKFLEKQQPYVDSWRDYYLKVGYKGKKVKLSNVDLYINEALVKIATVKSKYLKLRYFFLAFRLAHYYNKPSADSIYKQNKALLKDSNSIVKDWIQGLYAGLLLKTKDEKVKGIYEFTKLFEPKKTNWYLAFYNFKINTDKQWEELLSLAKNKTEKIKFFTIRALDSKANIIEELKNIASIDINSKYYDLLLFREILKSQHFFDIYPEDGLYYTSHDSDKKPFIKYLKSVSKKNMYMIDLALAYFSFYESDIKSSKEYLQKAYKLVKGDDIHELNALSYIIYINSLKTINKDIENEIGEKLDKLSSQQCNNNSIYKYTFYKVKDLYKKVGDEFKYIMSASYLYLPIENINLQSYKKIKALENKKNKTILEKYMLKTIIFKSNYFKEDLKRAYNKILLNNLQFEKALSLASNSNYKLDFNIFNNLIRGNNRKVVRQYTYKQTLEKIIQLKKNLKKDPNSPMDNYLYGTALYNLSFWGNLNSLTTIYKSTYQFREKDLELKKLNLSNEHLKRALKYTKDKEFKAKIIYMLAKNELALNDIKNSNKSKYFEVMGYGFDRSYSSWGYSFNEIEQYMADGYGKYFNTLKKDYSDTKYYEELINECANLRNYQKTLNELEQVKFEGTKKQIVSNIESWLKNLYETKQKLPKTYKLVYFWKLSKQVPITKSNVEKYNNIAFYLQKMDSYKSKDYAKMLLKKIIKRFPNRSVAYYNLGDIYWSDYERYKAKQMYRKYVSLMKKAKKEKRIPQKVKNRIIKGS